MSIFYSFFGIPSEFGSQDYKNHIFGHWSICSKSCYQYPKNGLIYRFQIRYVDHQQGEIDKIGGDTSQSQGIFILQVDPSYRRSILQIDLAFKWINLLGRSIFEIDTLSPYEGIHIADRSTSQVDPSLRYIHLRSRSTSQVDLFLSDPSAMHLSSRQQWRLVG